MKKSPPEVSFHGRLEKFDNSLWSYHIKIPKRILKELEALNIKRMVCTIQGTGPIYAGAMPAGNGVYFIKLNKDWVTKGDWSIGDELLVDIAKDRSDYGLPMPEELELTLAQDEEGSEFFHSLTPGKQRSLIYIISKIKNQELRISRSTIIVDHLKEENGSLDFRRLNDLFRQYRLQ